MAIIRILFDVTWKTFISRKVNSWEADCDKQEAKNDEDEDPPYIRATRWSAEWWLIDGRWVNKQGYFWMWKAWDQHRGVAQPGGAQPRTVAALAREG